MEAHAKYLRAEAGEDLAIRFIDAARDSFAALGATPYMGSRVGSRNPAFSKLRKWRVAGFSNYLIFYLPFRDGVDILRVIYGAQDWWTALDIDITS